MEVHNGVPEALARFVPDICKTPGISRATLYRYRCIQRKGSNLATRSDTNKYRQTPSLLY